MARTVKPITLKPHPPVALTTPSDPIDRDFMHAGFDPSYGETLGQLLPKRLHDLVHGP